MNFFEQQQQARRSTTRLVLLFGVAVAGVVLAVNLALALAFGFIGPGVQTVTAGGVTMSRGGPAGLHVFVSLATLALIGGGTWYQTVRLRTGGDAVAQMVGARPLDPSTRDLLERRLLNVVEEMALASGTPVPRVYIMDQENGINAFAAGHNINDAVIAVTRGTLTRLSRDELQGVIAHEFSHIFNGDMRLNLRLIGVLFGLLLLSMAGRFIMEVGRGGRDSKGAAAVGLGGLALFLIGYIGMFFGRLIKAAVSRQREFLADASAVQFTRNPDGIGGALRKIGGLAEELGAIGSKVDHPHAETLSHLFLAGARPSFVAGLYATHPPLSDRIRRIYGREMALLPAPEQPIAIALAGGQRAAPLAAPRADGFGRHGDANPLAAMVAPVAQSSSVAQAAMTQQIGTTPRTGGDFAALLGQRVRDLGLESAVRDSALAQLLVLALVVEKASAVGASQRRAIAETLGNEAAQTIDRLHAAVAQLPPGTRLALLDLAGPALRKLAVVQGDRLLMLAHTLIHADGRMTLAEFLLYTVLKRRVGSDSRRAVPVRYVRVQDLGQDVARVLSLIAHVRLAEDPTHAFSAGVQTLPELPLQLVEREQLSLDGIARALERLNQLAPLAKPGFIRACTAAAFVDGHTNWKAASCVRSICAALDAPLPPQIAEDMSV
ncbi:MAG: M48 family metallopeptidase [Burkholderiales bacterium]|nr:M48 family metallopeptidase [Burkholderiales bacterium]